MTCLAGMAQLAGALSRDRKVLGLTLAGAHTQVVGLVPVHTVGNQLMFLSPSLRAMNKCPQVRMKKNYKMTKVSHFKYINSFGSIPEAITSQ